MCRGTLGGQSQTDGHKGVLKFHPFLMGDTHTNRQIFNHNISAVSLTYLTTPYKYPSGGIIKSQSKVLFLFLNEEWDSFLSFSMPSGLHVFSSLFIY